MNIPILIYDPALESATGDYFAWVNARITSTRALQRELLQAFPHPAADCNSWDASDFHAGIATISATEAVAYRFYNGGRDHKNRPGRFVILGAVMPRDELFGKNWVTFLKESIFEEWAQKRVPLPCPEPPVNTEINWEPKILNAPVSIWCNHMHNEFWEISESQRTLNDAAELVSSIPKEVEHFHIRFSGKIPIISAKIKVKWELPEPIQRPPIEELPRKPDVPIEVPREVRDAPQPPPSTNKYHAGVAFTTMHAWIKTRSSKAIVCILIIVFICVLGDMFANKSKEEPIPKHHPPIVPKPNPPETPPPSDSEIKFDPKHQSSWMNSSGIRMMFIPCGTFVMGSPKSEVNREEDESQQTITLVSPYWMGQTEVTQKQWLAVMGANPSHFNGDELPVENVDWNQAKDFCDTLTKKEQASKLIPKGWCYRLPTEAEWEYACRAKSKETRYSALEDIAWHGDNSSSTTHAVGQKTPNSWDLHDMLGNVWEWCSDWHGDTVGTVTDRCVRGGSYDLKGKNCRAARRFKLDPNSHQPNLGFRIVLANGISSSESTSKHEVVTPAK